MDSERELLPTDPYDQLLTAIVQKVKHLGNQTAIKYKRETYVPPDGVKRDIQTVMVIKVEILNRFIDWPFTTENERIKTCLACDLIVWYKYNRPDLLYVLNNLNMLKNQYTE